MNKCKNNCCCKHSIWRTIIIWLSIIAIMFITKSCVPEETCYEERVYSHTECDEGPDQLCRDIYIKQIVCYE